MPRTPAPTSATKAAAVPAWPPAYDVRNILAGAGQARLMLDGKVYTLRLTRAGKLILTK